MSFPGHLRFAVSGLFAALAGLAFAAPGAAQDDTQARAPAPDFSDEPDFSAPENMPDENAPKMDEALGRMAEVIAALDGEAKRTGNNWEFTLGDSLIMAITDPNAGRMRIMTPIADASVLPEGGMERLMQANFDTALDARYAVGQGTVWGIFLHPLDSLTTRDFASGILQIKSLADTFGTTFSSGALNYGGGDSGAIIDEQLKQLLEELERRETV